LLPRLLMIYSFWPGQVSAVSGQSKVDWPEDMRLTCTGAISFG